MDEETSDTNCKQASKERVSYSSGINVKESMIAGIMFTYKKEGASPLSAKPLLLTLLWSSLDHQGQS